MRSLLALMIILAACGDDEFNGLPDGPVFPDTPGDMTTAGLVKLTITLGTTPRPDIVVYFQNSDSTLVAAATTDANGVASAVMEPGGFVTAIDPFPPLLRLPAGVAPPSTLKTFAGVKPGDELVLHEADRNSPTVNFTLLAVNEPDGNAVSYQLHGPCISSSGIDITHPNGAGSGAPGGAVSLQGCGGTTDLTVVAFDGSGPIKAFHKAGVVLTEGGTVDLTLEPYVAVEQATFEYTSVPANVASVNALALTMTTAGRQFEVFDGAVVTNNTGITPPRSRPVIGGATQVVSSQMFGGANGIHFVLDWAPTTTTYSLALGNILTPTILLAEYTSLPVYDQAQKAITWTIDPVGRVPDVIVGTGRFQREGAMFLDWRWEVAAPAVDPATSVRFPVLPSPDDRFNPQSTDMLQVVDDLISARVPGGYDAIRENVFAVNGQTSTGLPLGGGLVTGAAGQVVFQSVSSGLARKRPTAQQALFPFATRLRR